MLSSTVYSSIITRGCNAKGHWLGPWNFFQAMSEKPSERTTLLYHVSTPQAHLTQHFYWCRHLLLTDFLIFLFFGCRLKAQYNSGHQQVATNENRRSIGLKFSIFSTYWEVISSCTFVQISSKITLVLEQIEHGCQSIQSPQSTPNRYGMCSPISQSLPHPQDGPRIEKSWVKVQHKFQAPGSCMRNWPAIDT